MGSTTAAIACAFRRRRAQRSQLRGRAQILEAEDLGSGALQAKIRVTLEAEGVDKPVCVADTLSRLYF
jgi:hypothetical protein